MCLITCPKAEKRFVKKYGKKKKIKVYKMIELSLNKHLSAPYRNSYTYHPGFNYPRDFIIFSNLSIGKYKRQRRVSRGLHVYLNKTTARRQLYYNDTRSIITMYASPSDCIGVNASGHAVFTKLELSNRSYLQAIRNLKIKRNQNVFTS